MSMNRPPVVLITGVAGLMGSRLADYIVENVPGATIIGIDDLSGGFIENVNEKVIFYKQDVSAPSMVSKDGEPEAYLREIDEIFEKHKPDFVFHFAAYAAECLSPFIRRYNYINNLIATANIVNCCIKYKVTRLVFTSSLAVYGHQQPPFRENDVRNPIDPYGVAKAACEQDIEIAAEQHGLDYCILRPHNVYGAKQNIWDPYRNVIGIFMYKVLKGDPITVYGDGRQKRAFSCIDDSLEPMWRAAWKKEASKQIINLGGIHEYSINELAYAVLDTAHGLGIDVKDSSIIHLPARHEVKYAFSTYHKSQEILGFEHKTDLHEGVKKMWEWVLEQPERERVIWTNYELDDEIYPYWRQDALKDGYWKKVAEMDGEKMREIL